MKHPSLQDRGLTDNQHLGAKGNAKSRSVCRMSGVSIFGRSEAVRSNKTKFHLQQARRVCGKVSHKTSVFYRFLHSFPPSPSLHYYYERIAPITHSALHLFVHTTMLSGYPWNFARVGHSDEPSQDPSAEHGDCFAQLPVHVANHYHCVCRP